MSALNEMKKKYATEVRERWGETESYRESEQKTAGYDDILLSALISSISELISFLFPFSSSFYKTITNVPVAIKTQPINDFAVNCSCKNTNARTRVITTLNLSIGTTFDASPICNAL